MSTKSALSRGAKRPKRHYQQGNAMRSLHVYNQNLAWVACPVSEDPDGRLTWSVPQVISLKEKRVRRVQFALRLNAAFCVLLKEEVNL